MKKENRMYIVYFVIIMLQLLGMLYWANVKTNYHIDELFSMGYAHYYTEASQARYIVWTEDWQFNEWLDNAELKKYLCISEGQEIYSLPFIKAIVNFFVANDNHSGLLNFAESLAGYQTVSKWPGIALNICIFLLAEVILIALLTRLKLSKWSIALFLTMFGFCGYMISLVEFIRFYLLVMLFALVMILLHSVIWTSDKAWKIVVCEIGSFVMAHLGLKNSELMVVYAGALMGCFFMALLFTKQWKKLGVYAMVLPMALIYLACCTDWLDILFHIGYYAEAGGDKLSRVTTNIAGISGGGVATQLIQLAKWLVQFLFTEYYFGHRLLTIIWGALLVCIVFGEIRRIKKINLRGESGFVAVLVGTWVIYTAFYAIGLSNLRETRYYSLGFITFIIVLWYVIDRLLKQMPSRGHVLCYGLLTGLTVISCIMPFYTRNVQYIFEQDKDLISSLQPYQGTDVILEPYKSAEDQTLTTTAYDCITLMSDETRIYPIQITEGVYDVETFPEKFLLWAYVERDIGELIHELETVGYQVESLPVDHTSQVYICNKP